MSNIVANALTYVSDGIANGISRWTERTAGILAYFRQITASVRSVVSSKKTTIKWKVVLPYPETEPGSCPCPGEPPFSDSIINMDIRVDSRASAAHRIAVAKVLKDLANTTQVQDSIEDLVLPS